MADTPRPPDPSAPCATPCAHCRGATTTRMDLFKAPMGQAYKVNGNDYHTGEQYVSAMNRLLGEDGWSFRVLEHGFDEMSDEFWVLGELTARIWVHDPNDEGYLAQKRVTQQFGAQQVKRRRSDGRPQSTGDDRKAAATDSMKKCASWLGFGLYLWQKEPLADLPYRRDENEPWLQPDSPTPPKGRPAPAPRQPQDGPPAPPQGPDGANGTGGQPRPTGAPTGTKTPVSRERLEELYNERLAQATADGFRADWTAIPSRRLSDDQIHNYGQRLKAHIDRVQKIPGPDPGKKPTPITQGAAR